MARPNHRADAQETAWMNAWVQGDERAFELLFERLAPVLFGFFARSFGRGPLAEDLVQTTFLKLHRARDTYRQDASVRPWVFTIAARVRLDHLRKRKGFELAHSEEDLASLEQSAPDPTPDPADEALARSDRDAFIRAAIEKLPESQRVVVLLHRYEGLTLAEIASTLDTTEGAVKLRAHRAYTTLRKLLAPLTEQDARRERSFDDDDTDHRP
jgi:RNA polymerase sigma-70 factor (ECF subfamily)